MTATKIEAAKMADLAKTQIKYNTAKQIRELLDSARKSYGPTEFDDNGIESEIIDLVLQDDE